ncbi:MAG: hypothetical protein IT385_17380 [Deltaproteobacteria bacterium]|nr:hypothetical protein [Deltaproteobacteria bacterium]
MRRLAPLTLICLGLVASFVACGGEEPKRRLGSVCAEDPECGSGTCFEGQCVDPSADDDGDGLVNGEEIRLGTDPYDADTDRDGAGDRAELDAQRAHIDKDLDGMPDALESRLADRDADCVVDEEDPDDDAPDPTRCPEVRFALGAPSGWYTSESGREVTFTVALAAAPGRAAEVELDAGDEAIVSPARLHIDDASWARPRVVTVRGVDDQVADGHVDYEVTLTVTSPFLRGEARVALVNADDDLAGALTTLADDFDAARTPGLWRDEARHRSDTRVAAGALEHALDATGATSPVGGALGLDVPLASVRAVAARVTLVGRDAAARGRHEAVLRYLFQPAGAAAGSREGLVGFEVVVGHDGGDAAPDALPRVWSCADAACVARLDLPPPTPVAGGPERVAVAVGEALDVGLALDREGQAMTFTAGGATWTADFAGGPIAAVDLVRVELGAFATFDAERQLGGGTRLRFDDVVVDGATWDDFDSGRLADGAWLDALSWTSVEAGALVLEIGGDRPWFDAHLGLLPSAGPDAIAADVTLDDVFDGGGEGLAVVVGGVFGEAAIEVDGEPIGGAIEAHVLVFVDRTVAVVRTVLGTFEEVIGPAELGASQRVFVALDDRDLTLQVGDAPVLFRPERHGLVLDRAPALGVALEGFPATRAVVRGRARIDDVARGAAPP